MMSPIPKTLRLFLNDQFREIETHHENVITLTCDIKGVFSRITSPNEFAGPLVEGWAHIHLSRILEDYAPAAPGKQEFADAHATFRGQPILLNIKAKGREMSARSRINLSSFQRYNQHYHSANPAPYFVLVCEYEWRALANELQIIIERFKYIFDLLEIPPANYKIEGASEGSYRIFISPIPEVAKTESSIHSIMTPAQFLQRIEELKMGYDARKSSRPRN